MLGKHAEKGQCSCFADVCSVSLASDWAFSFWATQSIAKGNAAIQKPQPMSDKQLNLMRRQGIEMEEHWNRWGEAGTVAGEVPSSARDSFTDLTFEDSIYTQQGLTYAGQE